MSFTRSRIGDCFIYHPSYFVTWVIARAIDRSFDFSMSFRPCTRGMVCLPDVLIRRVIIQPVFCYRAPVVSLLCCCGHLEESFHRGP